MSKTTYAGIDYSHGRANRDPSNNIRYGVISINSLHEWIWDELESDYGEPHCPSCGNDGLKTDQDDYEYYCSNCEIGCTNDEVWSEEPLCFYIDDNQYKAVSAFDNTELFIERSPFYTFSQFCSPCAPGAGNLNSPCDQGAKTYCFGHDMFDGNIAPYPVYNVSDNNLVEPTKE